MAMGQAKGQAATLQVEMVCLDELVAEDDRYRRLDRLVDWSFVREVAAPYYARGCRAAVDRPDRAREADGRGRAGGDRLDAGAVAAGERASRSAPLPRLRPVERLPVHQTLSHAHTRRFVDAALFERLFLRSLELCKQHGLVEGTHISIDGFHAEADAALASLRASLALAAGAGGRGGR